jgi:hypothetical protein
MGEMHKAILPLVLLLVAPLVRALAQPTERVHDTNFNGWYMYFGDHPLGDSRWGLHLEGQWRRHDVITRWQQLLLRPGVNYQVHPNVLLTAGYAFVNTHRYGDFPAAEKFPEHRMFQQAAVSHRIGKAGLQHRYRLEQRFLGEVPAGAPGNVERWRHENRFRYMLRGAIPFRGQTIEEGDWYLALYNEFFINFGRNVAANMFDQNRAYGAAGWRLGKFSRLEMGYLNQIVQQRNGRIFEINHTLQVALFSALPFGKND